MTQFLESNTFMWSTSDSLGKGATGGVYKGRNKLTGELVAVKLFNSDTNAFWRELDIFQKTKPHPNIVKFFILEKEITEGRRNAIMMELCTGGSLYNVIDKPENGFGLDEFELKLVMKDVVSGMLHLHNQGIIHRDIKPGNIMRYVNTDGSHTYKLVDFGAARELGPGENFTSLYGTEEYLHPDMYERAVLKKNRGKTFTNSVDLWSIGATFYHAATGRLPFRPFFGRQDQSTMYLMTSKKESGVISAYQSEPNGQIIWERNLPNDVCIKPHLRLLLYNILSRILDSDPSKCMNFNEFSKNIFQISQMHVIHLFCVNDMSFHNIYIEESYSNKFLDLKSKVKYFTNISENDQLYFYNDFPLSENSEKLLPITTDEDPVILIGVLTTNFAHWNPPKPFINYSNEVRTIDKDYQMTKNSLPVLYSYKRLCQKCNQTLYLLESTSKTLINFYNKKANLLENIANKQSSLAHRLQLFNLLKRFVFDVDKCEDNSDVFNIISNIEINHNELTKLYCNIFYNFKDVKLSDVDRYFSNLDLNIFIIFDKQLDIKIKSINESLSHFIRYYKQSSSLLHHLDKENQKFQRNSACEAIKESIHICDKALLIRKESHEAFFIWFVNLIVNSLMKLQYMKPTLEIFEVQFMQLMITIERQIEDFLYIISNKTISADHIIQSKFVEPLFNDYWNKFVNLAGPSIIQLENFCRLHLDNKP